MTLYDLLILWLTLGALDKLYWPCPWCHHVSYTRTREAFHLLVEHGIWINERVKAKVTAVWARTPL